MLQLIENHYDLKDGHKYFIINDRQHERFIGTFYEEEDAFTNVTVLECEGRNNIRSVYIDDGYLGILSDDMVYEYEDKTDIVVEMI